MNQFVAPQFIDVEDRILGPITTRQFIMIVIAGIISFASYKLLDNSAFIFVSFLAVVCVVLFGFVKINGRYFLSFVSKVFDVLKKPKIRVWRKEVTGDDLARLQKKEDKQEVVSDFTPRRSNISSRRLEELALLVDTGGKFSIQ